ncbi:uncharacterized protein CLUP02_00954 [Colletotrichum lupini]|uniref:Uncharacterized protein n=1 Tax=Colletotrichum lupini TaxID=145971 RepID=A0A9Q8SCB8_9PEZI|nr:uncharacterized protein CLUP02_00954 [Colletotrichum lupini]UQC74306.1 hypothetical protein CLUP02_00954 [Colletotrichum lupini]
MANIMNYSTSPRVDNVSIRLNTRIIAAIVSTPTIKFEGVTRTKRSTYWQAHKNSFLKVDNIPVYVFPPPKHLLSLFCLAEMLRKWKGGKRGVQRCEESGPLRQPSYRQGLISCWHEEAVALPVDHGQTFSVHCSGTAKLTQIACTTSESYFSYSQVMITAISTTSEAERERLSCPI